MPIGLFARRSGLTSSALRFYADSGLLHPAEVDQVSGYRYYSVDQVARAIALRQLREIAMPLATVEEVLDAVGDEAARLIDEHVTKVVDDAMQAQRKAAIIKSSLAGEPGLSVATLKGPVLAAAVEQVLTATAHEPGLPPLSGLRIEATPEAVALTATDRYRLSTRTLVPAEPPMITWAGTINGDDLRRAMPEIRRGALVHLEATPHRIWLRVEDRAAQHCRLLPDEFPDYQLMLASLPKVSTRVTLSRAHLLRALEQPPGDRILLRMTTDGVHVLSHGEDRSVVALPAITTGQDLEIWFELTTLYPAVSTAIAPEVMLDLRGPDQSVTVRSADHGDLTTLAMPTKPDRSG